MIDGVLSCWLYATSNSFDEQVALHTISLGTRVGKDCFAQIGITAFSQGGDLTAQRAGALGARIASFDHMGASGVTHEDVAADFANNSYYVGRCLVLTFRLVVNKAWAYANGTIWTQQEPGQAPRSLKKLVEQKAALVFDRGSGDIRLIHRFSSVGKQAVADEAEISRNALAQAKTLFDGADLDVIVADGKKLAAGPYRIDLAKKKPVRAEVPAGLADPSLLLDRQPVRSGRAKR